MTINESSDLQRRFYNFVRDYQLEKRNNINTNKHIIKESFNLKKNNESYELKTKKDLDGRD